MLVKYPQVPVLPRELKTDFDNGLVVLFLGAGVSMPAGAPGWEDLTRPIRAKLPAGAEKLELSQVMSLGVAKFGPPTIRALLQKELDSLRSISVHKQIVKLPVDLILTTNYDPYLAEAARAEGREPLVITEDRLVTSCGDKNLKIVHLYGTTDDALSTEEDLVQFDRKRPALAMLLEHTLLTKTVLFLGFSLRDYNVLNHLLTSQTLVGGSAQARRHYAFLVMEDHNEAMIELWESRTLKLFGAHSVDRMKMGTVFTRFVTDLASAVMQKTYAEIDREIVSEREERRCLERSSRGMPLHMRRESTFSVLALPDQLPDDGITQAGHDLGKRRKLLYEQWITAPGGRIDLILNADLEYAQGVRNYNPSRQLSRLRELRDFLEKHCETGLCVVIRPHPRRRDTYASLDDEVLIISATPENSEGKAYKEASVIRDPIAVRVFNDLFDQELDSLLPPTPDRRVDDETRRHAGNRKTLAEIDAAIVKLEAVIAPSAPEPSV